MDTISCTCPKHYKWNKVTVAGLVKALRAVNGTTWHAAFLGLWIAALRLVQRVGIYETFLNYSLYFIVDTFFCAWKKFFFSFSLEYMVKMLLELNQVILVCMGAWHAFGSLEVLFSLFSLGDLHFLFQDNFIDLSSLFSYLPFLWSFRKGIPVRVLYLALILAYACCCLLQHLQ